MKGHSWGGQPRQEAQVTVALSLLGAGTGLGHCLPVGDLGRAQGKPGCSKNWHIQLGQVERQGPEALARKQGSARCSCRERRSGDSVCVWGVTWSCVQGPVAKNHGEDKQLRPRPSQLLSGAAREGPGQRLHSHRRDFSWGAGLPLLGPSLVV